MKFQNASVGILSRATVRSTTLLSYPRLGFTFYTEWTFDKAALLGSFYAVLMR